MSIHNAIYMHTQGKTLTYHIVYSYPGRETNVADIMGNRTVSLGAVPKFWGPLAPVISECCLARQFTIDKAISGAWYIHYSATLLTAS